MKKKILVFSHALELGGAERALIGLLYALDKSKYQVDLFLMRHTGPLMKQIPDGVNLLPENPRFAAVLMPMKQAILQRRFGVVFGRLLGKHRAKRYCAAHQISTENAIGLEYSHKYTVGHLPAVSDTVYDLAISFLTPHYFVAEKVTAKKKIAWIHTDYSKIVIDKESELAMWGKYDRIAAISEDTRTAFAKAFPPLADKLIIIENILVPELILSGAEAFSVADEMPEDGSIRILSVGRFCHAKNFDNVPDICRRLRETGHNVVWYLIGFGGDEPLIREKITEAGMQQYVRILGRKENPYPYMKACDLYVQPSRYEGNAVTVHEAQILSKPVVITRFPTAGSQLRDTIDGIIVPMDTEGTVKGISDLLNDPVRQALLAQNAALAAHTPNEQLKQIDRLLEGRNN